MATQPHGPEINLQPVSGVPSFSLDDRAERLLEYLNAEKAKYENNPDAIIAGIEKFVRSGGKQNWFPIYSEAKIAISRGVLENLNSCKTIVEMGVCVGTSALGWGKMVKDFNPGNKDVKVYALELDEKMCNTARQIIKLGGLEDYVEVIQGPADASIQKLVKDGSLKVIDALFLDHWKDRYVPDLLLCEDLKLFRVGSVILADNTDSPGAPDYVAYVQTGGRSDKIKYETTVQSTTGGGPRDVMISTVKAVV